MSTPWMYPQSPRGRATFVPPPPWNFSSDVFGVDFAADPGAVAQLIPDGLEPRGDGGASLVFGAWSASADADPRLAADPGRGQYNEAFVVVYATLRGRPIGVVPYIWVDSDLALVRGTVQGFSKRAGEITMTRAFSAGRGGPRRTAGAQFTGTVTSVGRRIVTANVVLGEPSDVVPAGVSTRLALRRHFPDLTGGAPLVDDFVSNEITDFEAVDIRGGTGELSFDESEFEDLDLIAPKAITGGWIASIGYTLVGSRVLEP